MAVKYNNKEIPLDVHDSLKLGIFSMLVSSKHRLGDRIIMCNDYIKVPEYLSTK